MSNRVFNWKREPEDPRDFQVQRHEKLVSVPLPSIYELPADIPIYDQSDLGSCVSNSSCAAYRFESEQLSGDFKFNPSRLFLYYNARMIDGTDPSDDAGTYVRSAFKSLNQTGVCHEEFCPYETEKFSQKPGVFAYADAPNNMIVRYASVPQDLTALKQVLVSGAGIVFGFNVYESFEQGNWDSTTGMMPIPKKNENILGGHSTILVGYADSKQAFLVQNSWGTEWGLQGKFWMPYSFLLDPKECDDFWCIDEIKVNPDEPIPDPEPIDPIPDCPTNKEQAFFVAKSIFKTGKELYAVKKETIVLLGQLLELPVSMKISFKKNYTIVAQNLGL